MVGRGRGTRVPYGPGDQHPFEVGGGREHKLSKAWNLFSSRSISGGRVGAAYCQTKVRARARMEWRRFETLFFWFCSETALDVFREVQNQCREQVTTSCHWAWPRESEMIIPTDWVTRPAGLYQRGAAKVSWGQNRDLLQLGHCNVGKPQDQLSSSLFFGWEKSDINLEMVRSQEPHSTIMNAL